jgi:hypothetical protein
MTHPYFKQLIAEWWKGFVESDESRMYAFQQKLKHIKTHLKIWNKETFGKIMEERIRLEALIGEIQNRVMRDGYIEEERTKEGELIQELAKSERQEEILWR